MSLEQRPNARGGRAARRANQRELEADRLKALGALSKEQMVHEQSWAEKLNCPICRQAVHPTNWSAHMALKHADKIIPLHEAEPGRLPLTAIRIDGGTQPRAYINGAVVDDYRQEMKDGKVFPAIIVFYDGADYWLADGFHRVDAAKQAGLTDLAADVRQGTQRDAILFSVGANAAHGYRRTNDDKRRAVNRLLLDAEWGKWSNREIAERCSVSHQFVNNMRTSLPTVASEIRTFTTKHGTPATMNTGNIGKSTPPVQYGKIEDDYQPEVPEVQVDEGREDNAQERQLGGRGAKVQARSGQTGTVVFVNGRIAHVDTPNGRREYDALYLKKVNAPVIDDTDEPDADEGKTLYPVTPSDDEQVERARQYALEAIGDSRDYIENQIKGHAGHGSSEYFVTFGGGAVFLNYRDNGFPPSQHKCARNQVAIRLTIDDEDHLFRFNAFKLLGWKLANQPAQVDPPPPTPDYKRDSKVTRAANEYEPQGYDACQTPAYAIDPLLPHLATFLTIWEPAAGEGLLVEALYDSELSANPMGVIASDILTGQNFFDYEPEHAWDCIVTNPPFSLKFKWLERCYALGKPFALLLPVETLAAATAQKMFDEYGVEVIFMNKRINFKMPNKGWDGAGAQFGVAWFTWGLGIGKEMTYARLETNDDPE